VDHALLVGGLERLGDLAGDVQRVIHGHRAPRESLGQILAGDHLHGDEAQFLGTVQPVDRCDVRVVKRGQQLGLAFESLQAFRVVRQIRRQRLDRHLAVERRVDGAPDDAHPALADLVHE
jgi:hypothetical protein